MSTTSTALTVVNRLTGETIDVRAAETEALGRFQLAAEDVVDELKVAKSHVNTELLARLDKSLSWTHRLGDPRLPQVEITAPSPDAGTVAYPELGLERELRALVGRGIVTEIGAAAALERKLVVTFAVPLHADLDELAERARAALTIDLGGETLTVEAAEPRRRSIMAGIKRLAKLDGTAAALKRAAVEGQPKARVAKVKLVTRER